MQLEVDAVEQVRDDDGRRAAGHGEAAPVC